MRYRGRPAHSQDSFVELLVSRPTADVFVWKDQWDHDRRRSARLGFGMQARKKDAVASVAHGCRTRGQSRSRGPSPSELWTGAFRGNVPAFCLRRDAAH